MTVSKQSAVNAGEKTRTFFIPLAGKDFNTSSEMVQASYSLNVIGT